MRIPSTWKNFKEPISRWISSLRPGLRALGRNLRSFWMVWLLAGAAAVAGIVLASNTTAIVPPDRPPAVAGNNIRVETSPQVKTLEPDAVGPAPEGSPTAPVMGPVFTAEAGYEAEYGQYAGTVEEVEIDPISLEVPLKGTVKRRFGFAYSTTFQDYRFHRGVDIVASPGTPALAAAEGLVIKVGMDTAEGYRVEVAHHGKWSTVYSQLEGISVKEGERVKSGQVIGYVGNPGLAEVDDGTHLHFELLRSGEPEDPEAYWDGSVNRGGAGS